MAEVGREWGGTRQNNLDLNGGVERKWEAVDHGLDSDGVSDGPADVGRGGTVWAMGGVDQTWWSGAQMFYRKYESEEEEKKGMRIMPYLKEFGNSLLPNHLQILIIIFLFFNS